MIVPDANILLYAFLPDFPQHMPIAEWLKQTLSKGSQSLGIAWPAANAFLRISTNFRIFDDPLGIDLARSHLDHLFSHPKVIPINPTDNHWKTYSAMLTDLDLVGDIIMDAHLAVIAREHNAAIASTDKHFRRFTDYVKIIDPLKK